MFSCSAIGVGGNRRREHPAGCSRVGLLSGLAVEIGVECLSNEPGHWFARALLFQPEAAQVFRVDPRPIISNPLRVILRQVEPAGAGGAVASADSAGAL